MRQRDKILHLKKQHGSSPTKGIVLFGLFGLIAAMIAAYMTVKIEPIAYSIRGSATKAPAALEGLRANLEVLDINVTGVAHIAFRPAKDSEEKESASANESEETPRTKREDAVYAALVDGRVVEIDLKTKNVHTLLETGTPALLNSAFSCGAFYTEAFCGRPTQLSFDQDGLRLLVLDPYHGLFMVDVDERTNVPLLKEDNDGESFTYLHSMAVSRNTGIIYITQPSTKFHRRDWRNIFLEQKSEGRLLKYDPATGLVTTLSKKLAFPTGIVIVEGKDGQDESILITEVGKARIRRFTLPKKKDGKGVMGNYVENMGILPIDLAWNPSHRTLYVTGLSRTPWFESMTKLPFARRMLGWFYDSVFDILLPLKSVIYQIEPRSVTVRKVIYGDPAVGTVAHSTTLSPHDDKLYVSSHQYTLKGLRRWGPI